VTPRSTIFALACIVVAVPPGAALATPAAPVGSLASLTGTGSDYGIGQARGSALAAAQFNAGPGQRVRLVLRDDRSSPRVGARVTRRLLSGGVVALIGPTLSSTAAATGPIASAAGVPVLAVTNTTLDLREAGPSVWRICLAENRLIPASVRYAVSRRGVRSAALLSVTGDAYSEGAANEFRRAAARQGVRLVADLSVPTGTADLAEVVAAAGAAAPDALFFAARSTDAAILLAAAADVDAVKVGGNGYNAPDVLKRAGRAADGLIVSASWNPNRRDAASRAFVRSFRARYGTTPDAFAAQGYAGVQVLRSAIQAGGGTSPARISAGLRRLTGVSTVLGQGRMSRGREAVYPATVQTVKAGRLVLAP
jgi:branched-chain amino acid transport system substrate-binding protein